jgi:hypothetical protein
MAHFGSSFLRNRTDSATFKAGRIQLFHSAKIDLVRPLSATFGNVLMDFFIQLASFPLGQNRQKWPTNRLPGNPVYPQQRLFIRHNTN